MRERRTHPVTSCHPSLEDLFGKELVAIDGSKFRVCNSNIKHIDKKIEEYMQELEDGDLVETKDRKPTAQGIKKRIQEPRKIVLSNYQFALFELDGFSKNKNRPLQRAV